MFSVICYDKRDNEFNTVDNLDKILKIHLQYKSKCSIWLQNLTEKASTISMNKPTINQHYIWRNYLAAWTKTNSTNGQIVCLRKNKIFPVSLMKVAQENCFYGVKEMTKQERALIFAMTVHNKSVIQRSVHVDWLNLYCAPFDYVDDLVILYQSYKFDAEQCKIRESQEFKNWNIDLVEKLHADIEHTGEPYISSLRQDNLDFWKNEEARDIFSFFLCNQYFRTRKMRDGIITAFEHAKHEFDILDDINPENIWIPLTLIFSSDVGVNITQNFSAVLLKSKNTRFVVGDQPVINTYATYDVMNPTTDLELFYPITPYSALLLTTDKQYTSGQSRAISDDEVARYNMLQFRSSREMIFAIAREDLEAFISHEQA